MPNLGLLFFTRGFNGPAELARFCGEMEALGFDHLFMTESANDAMTTLAGIATATKTATIGSGIANIYIRHPYEIANAAAAVDDLSGGRLMLGLGTAHQITNVHWLGLDMSKPLSRMRDYLAVVRAALDSQAQPIHVKNDRYQVMGARVAWAPKRRLPLIVAALSDGMARAAAELGDGVILSLATLRQIREVRALLEETARAHGRDPKALTIIAIANIALRPTRAEAQPILKQGISGYFRMPFYQRELARNGIPVENFTIPDSAVDLLGIAGPVSYAKECVAAYREAGADVVLLAPTGNDDVQQGYRDLAAVLD
ncbi:MAG: LLM class flavin-dependent oxidoreductase [Dehalococcoidia bacterium]|nr:LLM class flavin-dependent oxidoreductase [Dehalococcoidia bacterium]